MVSQEVRALEAENRNLKKTIERLAANFNEKEKRPMACEWCKYFLQHYVYVDGRFTETCCGHCTHGRCKGRKPETKSCQYFELGSYGSGR